MNWIYDRAHDLRDLGSAGWLAIAAWAALAFGIVVLAWANRQMTKNRQLKAEQVRPQVTMFMEPHPSDWHVIELVVRNFGHTAATTSSSTSSTTQPLLLTSTCSSTALRK